MPLTKLKSDNIGASAVSSTAMATMGAASAGAAGTKGAVPAPDAGEHVEFLRGDGTWAPLSMPSVFVGDSGSGGTAGTVPAPASGDAAANKFLKADGNWTAIPASDLVNDTSPQLGGTLDTNGKAINETRAVAVSSATTTDIGAISGNFVHVTGTTTITGLGTVAAGTERTLTFDASLTLTHNGTSLVLPTAANITTAAGDSAVFRSEGSGNWRCVAYQKADGQALVGASLNASLTSFSALGAAGKIAYTTGTNTWAETDVSASGRDLLSASGTTGTGSVVRASSPTLVTPSLGAATATTLNGVTITATSGVLTVANGKTLTASNTLTFSGTDSSTLNVGTGGTLGTSAYTNTGTSSGNVPVLNGSGKLVNSVIPTANVTKSMFVETPLAKTYVLEASVRTATTIVGSYGTVCGAGTCVITVKINTTAVTGLSGITVTDNPQNLTASANNVAAIGDTISVEVTSPTAASDFTLTLEATRSF